MSADVESAPIGHKLRTLLAIAGKAQENGHLVTGEDVVEARRQGQAIARSRTQC